jgi:hypothetical protein
VPKGLLIWNIVLTVIVLGGLAAGFFFYNNYYHVTEQSALPPKRIPLPMLELKIV